jgi:hypothetical protein
MNKNARPTASKNRMSEPQREDSDVDAPDHIDSRILDLITKNSTLKIELAQTENNINLFKQINENLKGSITIDPKPKYIRPQQGEDDDEINSVERMEQVGLMDMINSLMDQKSDEISRLRLQNDALIKMINSLMDQLNEISRLRSQNDTLTKYKEEEKCLNIIIHARYHKLDITERLIALLNGSGEILLPNSKYPLNLLFSDPAPGETKFLLIVYKIGNEIRSLFWKEKDSKDNLSLKLW